MTWSRNPPARAGGQWRTRRIIAACDCGGQLTDEPSEVLDIIRVGEKLFAVPSRGTRAIRPLEQFAGHEWERVYGD